MSESTDHAEHVQRIKSSVDQRDLASTELEQAKLVEAKARAVREEKAITLRAALDDYHRRLYEAWQAGVDIPLILATAGISKSRLYAVIKKLDAEH